MVSKSEGVNPPLHVGRGRHKVGVKADRARPAAATAAAAGNHPRRAQQRLGRDAVIGALLKAVGHEPTEVPGETGGIQQGRGGVDDGLDQVDGRSFVLYGGCRG